MTGPRLAALCAIVVTVRPLGAQVLDAPSQLGDGLKVAAPATVGLRAPLLAALGQALIDDSFPKTTSVLVLKDGRLAFERYFEGGGLDVLNNTRSATKTITALALGAALADGALTSVDEPAFPRLADRAPFRNDGPLKRQITLADLLTMSSALDCNDWDDASPGNEEKMYPLADWARWAADLPVKPDYQRDSSGRGPFSYCTAGVFLLGQVVQRAVRESIDIYVSRRLLAPLGITEHEWARSPSGEVMTGGGLELRSRDLAKLGLLIQSGGRWGGQQILPATWLAQMLTVRRAIDADTRYGYLIWERDYRSPCGRLAGWFMSGNGGNVVVDIPSQQVVVVVTRQHYNQRGMHQQTLRLLEDHVFAALVCAAPGS